MRRWRCRGWAPSFGCVCGVFASAALAIICTWPHCRLVYRWFGRQALRLVQRTEWAVGRIRCSSRQLCGPGGCAKSQKVLVLMAKYPHTSQPSARLLQASSRTPSDVSRTAFLRMRPLRFHACSLSRTSASGRCSGRACTQPLSLVPTYHPFAPNNLSQKCVQLTSPHQQ